MADRLYPGTSTQATQGSSKDLESDNNNGNAEEVEDEDDIEAQIAKELEDLQPARDPDTGKKKMRFQGVRTDTECCESTLYTVYIEPCANLLTNSNLDIMCTTFGSCQIDIYNLR